MVRTTFRMIAVRACSSGRGPAMGGTTGPARSCGAVGSPPLFVSAGGGPAADGSRTATPALRGAAPQLSRSVWSCWVLSTTFFTPGTFSARTRSARWTEAERLKP